MKRIKELRKKSIGELSNELKKEQETFFKLRFQKVIEEVTDLTQVKKQKKKIAQIKTLIKEKELESKAK